jgi:hypothetical protein
MVSLEQESSYQHNIWATFIDLLEKWRQQATLTDLGEAYAEGKRRVIKYGC